MFIALLAAGLCFQPAQVASIAYEGNAAPLQTHLEAISKQVGRDLRAAGSLRADMLVIRVDEPVETLMAQLAAAESAVWRKDGNHLILEPDIALAKKLRLSRLTSRIERIRKAQDKMREKLGGPFNAATAKSLIDRFRSFEAKFKDNGMDQGFQDFDKMKPLMPAHQALLKVLSGLDPAVLAEGGDVPLVYSDRPNRLQLPLTAAGVKAVRQLEKDQTVWATTYHEIEPEGGAGGHWTADPRFYLQSAGDGDLRLILKVNRSEDGPDHVTAWFVDAKYQLRQFAEMSFDLSAQEGPTVKPTPPTDSADFELPESAKAWGRVFHMQTWEAEAVPIKDLAIRAAIRNPVQNEPLGLTAGPILLALARREKLNLVGHLTDGAFLLPALLAKEGDFPAVRPKQVFSALLNTRCENVREGNSWVIRPTTAAGTLDRRFLASAVQEASAKGCVSMETVAPFLSGFNSRRDDPSLLTRYLDAAVPGLGAATQLWGTETLGVFGTLSSGQRQQLLSGAKIPLKALPAATYALLERITLSAQGHEMHVDDAVPGRNISLAGEPTEILVSGIDPDAFLSMTVSTEPACLAKQGQRTTSLGAWSLADAIVKRRKGSTDYWAGFGDTATGRYWPSTTTNYTFSLHLSPRASLEKSAAWSTFDMRPGPVVFANLPEAFRKTVDEGVKAIGSRE